MSAQQEQPDRRLLGTVARYVELAVSLLLADDLKASLFSTSCFLKRKKMNNDENLAKTPRHSGVFCNHQKFMDSIKVEIVFSASSSNTHAISPSSVKNYTYKTLIRVRLALILLHVKKSPGRILALTPDINVADSIPVTNLLNTQVQIKSTNLLNYHTLEPMVLISM